jgi:hypothetical protein
MKEVETAKGECNRKEAFAIISDYLRQKNFVSASETPIIDGYR